MTEGGASLAGYRFGMPFDLVLSSGFLAFARQAGFLDAVQDAGLAVDGVCGTSSGALAGALWAAGWRPDRILEELTAQAPLWSTRPSWTPWRGLLSMDPVLARLRQILPETFEELERPFGVGVVSGGAHVLLTSGPLVEAVTASCALPHVFGPIRVGDRLCSDGGALDRTGLVAWRRWRGPRPTVLHLVDRTAGAPGGDLPKDVVVVRSGRSDARLWALGDVRRQHEETREAAGEVLRKL